MAVRLDFHNGANSSIVSQIVKVSGVITEEFVVDDFTFDFRWPIADFWQPVREVDFLWCQR